MKKYIFLLLFILIIVADGCKKDFLSELSANPNTPSSATPALLLSGALKGAASIPNGQYNATQGIYTQYGCWMGQLTWSSGYQANVQLYSYAFTSGDYNVWTPLYGNISNFSAIAATTTEPNYLAIAKIMTAYDYQQLVDNYNDVPYSQSIEGVKNLTPKYDKGTDIYDDLMKQLDAAITLIQKAPTSAANPGGADIIFQGNMGDWIKFANTLKLKLAIRQWDNVSAKQPTLKAAVSATASLGYIDDSFEAAANPGYTNSDAFGGQESPFWLVYGFNQNGGANTYNVEYQANSYAINFFTSNNDPRLQQVYAPNPSGNIVGTYFGQLSTVPAGLTPSTFGPGLLISPTMPAVILSSSESLFLQAEAVNDGLISGDAATLYNDGITASFIALKVPNAASAAATYYAQSGVSYPATGSPEQKKQFIITQKWAALFGYGFFEVYNEYRRTGYPNNIPLSQFPGVNAPNQPTRILYPIIEYQTNATNVQAEGTIDKFNSKIFWAKQ